ncbi:hypothetical protein AB832_05220 [Flavobacteriaceae bacterium (ex Bugula neritina AB1)]|nr:hypothetical protein AB832_05220 [Flavobacteriaceae bacterium (ex Bugula neritina AB1)]
MKTYNAVFNPLETEGVFGISLVQDPAMEGQFIALSKQKEIVQLKSIDDEKRILIGLVLEPNKPIYRNQNGEEFNIVFNEETIKELSYNFFKAGYHKNSTIEHDETQRIEGVTFVESWIVDDSEKDKSAVYGFSYPKGSWLATMKVDSDEVWQEYVKTGKVQGFSVDAMIKLEEIKLNKMSKEKKQNVLEALYTGLSEIFKKDEATEIKMGMIKVEDGSVTLEYEGETLEAGTNVWITAEDGTKVPAPVGEHKIEDGRVLVISEEGVTAEVKQMEDAPQEEELSDEAPTAEADEDFGDIDELINQIKKITVQYSKQLEEKEEKENEAIVELKKEVESLKLELSEIKEQPAATTIKSQPTQVELSQPATKKGRLLEGLSNLKN